MFGAWTQSHRTTLCAVCPFGEDVREQVSSCAGDGAGAYRGNVARQNRMDLRAMRHVNREVVDDVSTSSNAHGPPRGKPLGMARHWGHWRRPRRHALVHSAKPGCHVQRGGAAVRPLTERPVRRSAFHPPKQSVRAVKTHRAARRARPHLPMVARDVTLARGPAKKSCRTSAADPMAHASRPSAETCTTTLA